MKQIILDTSFILTCVRQKIDFFEELTLKGFEIVIPSQVIDEIRSIGKDEAKTALKMIEKNDFKKIKFGSKNVDRELGKYAKDNKDIIIATLDKEIKKELKGRIMLIRGKKKLEII